ncbi:MAG: transposase [Ignavibacteriaceae bacterium]
MASNSSHNTRRSIRLKHYDYTNPNWYYVTICVDDRKQWLGKVTNSKVLLSRIGDIAKEYWENIPYHFKQIELDYFVIMPNHIHGIIIINECRDVQSNIPANKNYFSKISPPKGHLGVIVRTFKAAVKKWCNENGYVKFKWQRNYYEHIIRNEEDLYHIRQYIELNPLRWELDDYFTM